MLDETEIAKRKPVWVALSELWLDREITAEDLDCIACTLAESEFTSEQLRNIYLHEVAPAVWANLLATAGAWAGFDSEWLSARILRRLERPSLRAKLMTWFPVTRYWMTSGTEAYWPKLMERVRTAREKSGA